MAMDSTTINKMLIEAVKLFILMIIQSRIWFQGSTIYLEQVWKYEEFL